MGDGLNNFSDGLAIGKSHTGLDTCFLINMYSHWAGIIHKNSYSAIVLLICILKISLSCVIFFIF